MMRIKMLFVLVCCFYVTNVMAQKPKLTISPHEVKWFKEAKFGMFIHWGLYSMLEGSYDGRTMPDASLANGESWYAEWIQMRLEVPAEEYKKLADNFNPICFNADQWIEEAKNAGMRYFVITAKHHDGYALWDTNVSEFKITNSPFKRDVLAELVAACKKYGVKYGFYYSHWQDWEYPGGAMPNWMKKVDDAAFEQYWQKKSLPQVVELLDRFDPDLLWFDTWDWETHITDERRDELIALVRSHSSKCLINGRISFNSPGEDIDFLEMHDNQYPDKIMDKPWQTPATMVHSWGWHAKDYHWKSSKQMISLLLNNTSKGGNYLLNIGPKPDGSFPTPATRRLREMGAWLLSNGEAVYDTQPVKIEVPEGVYLTQKRVGEAHELYITLSKTMPSFKLPIHTSQFTTCHVLETAEPIRFSAGGDQTTFHVPERIFNDCALVVLKVMITAPL